MQPKPSTRGVAFALTIFIGACALSAPACAGGNSKAIAQFKELLQESLAKKFGLQFYLQGQVIPGIVTKITDDNVVEVKNQEHERIMIRLDRVDAIAH